MFCLQRFIKHSGNIRVLCKPPSSLLPTLLQTFCSCRMKFRCSCIVSHSLKVYLPSVQNTFYNCLCFVHHTLKLRKGQKVPGVWKEMIQTLLFVIFKNFVTSQSLFSSLPYWSVANELEASSFTAPSTVTDQREIWILTMSFRHHVTGGSISFPYRAVRMASFWPPQLMKIKETVF